MKTFKMIRNIIRWTIAIVILGGGTLLYLAVEFPNHMAYMFDGGQHQRQVEVELNQPITPSVCYHADCRHNGTSPSYDTTANNNASANNNYVYSYNLESVKVTKLDGNNIDITGKVVGTDDYRGEVYVTMNHGEIHKVLGEGMCVPGDGNFSIIINTKQIKKIDNTDTLDVDLGDESVSVQLNI